MDVPCALISVKHIELPLRMKLALPSLAPPCRFEILRDTKTQYHHWLSFPLRRRLFGSPQSTPAVELNRETIKICPGDQKSLIFYVSQCLLAARLTSILVNMFVCFVARLNKVSKIKHSERTLYFTTSEHPRIFESVVGMAARPNSDGLTASGMHAQLG